VAYIKIALKCRLAVQVADRITKNRSD